MYLLKRGRGSGKKSQNDALHGNAGGGGSQKVQKVEKIYHVRMSSGLSQKWPILILKMDFLAILSIYKRISKLFIVQMFVTCCTRYFFLANNAVIYCNRPQKDKQKRPNLGGK